MKISLNYKRKRTQHFDSLMSQITKLEESHKTKPHPTQTAQLLTLRQELRILLLQSFENTQRKIKATSYASSNNAEKMLARRIKGGRTIYTIHTLTRI